MKVRFTPLILSFVLGALVAPLAAQAQEAGKVFRVGWIVAYTDPAILAAKRATNAIPIVMVGSSDPVGAGFVASLGRPGGNVTGVTDAAAEIAGKQLELLKEVSPRASRVTILFPSGGRSEPVLEQTRAAAQALGITLVLMEVWGRKDVERAFAAVTRDRTNALMVLSRGLMDYSSLNLIGQIARKHKVPVMSDEVKLTYEGGLMSYATSYAPQARRAAQYADRILKGSKPADLPVEQPTEFELTLNLETARALGLTIPPSVRLRANKVIE